MSMNPLAKRIAIACGGTGGHLFPGLAVGDTFVARGCGVTLLVSPKEVDQTAVKSAYGMEVESLPMVALSGNLPLFAACFWSSLGQCRKLFCDKPPDAVLAMGGFTSAPPVIAGKMIGARIFLHEANAIPGRAVKLLAPLADEVFVQFPTAMPRVLSTKGAFELLLHETCRRDAAKLAFPIINPLPDMRWGRGKTTALAELHAILSRESMAASWDGPGITSFRNVISKIDKR